MRILPLHMTLRRRFWLVVRRWAWRLGLRRLAWRATAKMWERR